VDSGTVSIAGTKIWNDQPSGYNAEAVIAFAGAAGFYDLTLKIQGPDTIDVFGIIVRA
jgi:hypothetical protein